MNIELQHSPSAFKVDDARLLICYGPAHSKSELWSALLSDNLNSLLIRSLQDAIAVMPAFILLDPQLTAVDPAHRWHETFPQALFLSESSAQLPSDLILSDGLPERQSVKLIAMARDTYQARISATKSKELLESTERNLSKLAGIGIALSSENDLAVLLRKILTEGQNISCCDAASLFLVNSKGRQITFKLTQNDSFDFPFQESSFDLDGQSIAGYVVLTKEPLNISDAYQIPDDAPYIFNRSFDNTTGYRTISMLTLPAMNKKNPLLLCCSLSIRKSSGTCCLPQV